jgi:uncharacterized protein (DUF302 family)
MSYHFSKTIETKDFNQAIEQVTAALKTEGFGILTEIDVTATFKKKLDIDFKNYRILGACNPQFAHKAISAEDKIGVFLPCNALVQQHEDDTIEISLVDPIASMQSVENPALGALAGEVQEKMKKVLAAI